MSTAAVDFTVGQVYDRRRDTHDRFGGQRQGGISTPSRWPVIFLFTGASGETYGYKDSWGPTGTFEYTGEGQTNHMEFVRGNKAIRDHSRDGKDLLLFEQLGKQRGVKFSGRFACGSWERTEGRDKDGRARHIITFHLVPAEGQQVEQSQSIASATPLAELRKLALAAATSAPSANSKQAVRTYHERSEAVRSYVLARGGDRCECCQRSAPFLRKDGSPYLEPHHTRRLADGGPDHPRWVGAVCPNCHREIHYGQGGKSLRACPESS